jgi:hypothetical protein
MTLLCPPHPSFFAGKHPFSSEPQLPSDTPARGRSSVARTFDFLDQQIERLRFVGGKQTRALAGDVRAGRDEIIDLRAGKRADGAADLRAGDAGAEQREARAE